MPIWLSNSPRNNDKSIIQEKIKQILKYNISEFSFNFDYSLCPKCKYFVKDILNKCPKCDSSEDLKVLAKITNYYSPVELWNEGKKQEFRDRVRIDF
jgi:ribonucleoside-triphosphate reductase